MSGEQIYVDRQKLKPLIVKPSLLNYLKQLWGRRNFIWADAQGKAFRTTRDYFLWRVWLILVPMFDIAVYTFIFGFVLKLSRGIPDFISFLVIGVIFFGFMQSSLTSAMGLIQVNRNLIDSFNFPRASVVVSHIVRYFLDNLVPALVAVIAAIFLKDEISVSPTVLLVVPIYFLIHIFGLGLMLIVARLSAFHPETKIAVKLLSQAWFFMSGVFFSIERFVEHPTVQTIMLLNPAYKFLEAVRDTAVYNTVPSFESWLELIAWSFGLLITGLIFFWRAEEKYAGIK